MLHFNCHEEIFSPQKEVSWATHSALQPTPLVLDDRIRIYAGLRDESGISRIGYIDVSHDNPSNVLGYSPQPALDIGADGMFDDHGVVPSAITQEEGTLYLYYAGYQLLEKVRFSVFGGLAVSNDDGKTFQRVQQSPIFERNPNALLFRVPHSVIREKGQWRLWYGAGNHFISYQGATLPSYHIRHLSSERLDSVPSTGQTVIDVCNEQDEYRIARPYVVYENGHYRMFYCVATPQRGYRLGYADSDDGLNWQRKDHHIRLHHLPSWASDAQAYPAFVRIKGNAYLFFNGNQMGYEGFGYARLNTESKK